MAGIDVVAERRGLSIDVDDARSDARRPAAPSTEAEVEDALLADARTEMLSVLGCSIRLEILQRLTHGPQDVSALAEMLELEIDQVSYHLRVLRKHGIVDFRKEKTRRIYRLAGPVEAESSAHHMHLRMRVDGSVQVTFDIERVAH